MNADRKWLLKHVDASQLASFVNQSTVIENTNFFKHTFRKIAGGKGDRICHHDDMKCMQHILEKKDGLEKFCDCLPDCNKIDYNFEIIEEREKLRAFFFTNISASIYFVDNEFVAYKRYESYGTVSLLSNIGGLLGLFLGISVLSVFEVVYFVTLRLFHDLWFNRQ